jgi:CheY-like chemotaxis protein
VIDDHTQLRLMLRIILRSLGARDILEAPDGREGLKLTQESQPDIVIADWAMEPMDGFEMTKTLRKS